MSTQGFNGGRLMMLGLGACFKSVLLTAAEERGIEVRSLRVVVTAAEADGPFRYDAIDMRSPRTGAAVRAAISPT